MRQSFNVIIIIVVVLRAYVYHVRECCDDEAKVLWSNRIFVNAVMMKLKYFGLIAYSCML
jgi:hypothetical protein